MQEEAELKSQIERLEAARREPALLALVPAVVAAGFGALPIGVANGVLEVAVAASASPRATAALGRVIGRAVAPVPFGDALIHVYLRRMYLRERNETLNFHTFVEEDFLERESSARLLREQKEHEPVKPHVHPDPERLVLLDYAYRSVLWNLDAPSAPAPFQAGETELSFDVAEGPAAEPVVSRREDVPPSVLILARESYSNAGIEHAHGWRAHEIRRLPFLVHPTELQITGIEADGTLHLFIYDRVERVRPGEARRFACEYYFLSMGQRYRRRLVLKIYGIWSVPRAKLRRTVDSLPWRPQHLERWLGFDLSEASDREFEQRSRR
jgi:hypothetical protein